MRERKSTAGPSLGLRIAYGALVALAGQDEGVASRGPRGYVEKARRLVRQQATAGGAVKHSVNHRQRSQPKLEGRLRRVKVSVGRYRWSD